MPNLQPLRGCVVIYSFSFVFHVALKLYNYNNMFFILYKNKKQRHISKNPFQGWNPCRHTSPALIKDMIKLNHCVSICRAWRCRWKMWGSEPRTLTGKGFRSPTAFWRSKTEASGDRSVTRTGRRWTPGSSVACTASPGRSALICGPTSEWWCGQSEL